MVLSRLELSELVISILMNSEIQIVLGNQEYRQLLDLKHQLPIVKAKQSQAQNQKFHLQQILEKKEEQLKKAYLDIKQLSRYCVQLSKKANEANQNEENYNFELLKKQQQLLNKLMIQQKEGEEHKIELEKEKQRVKTISGECETLMLQVGQLKEQIIEKNRERSQRGALDKKLQNKLLSLEEEQMKLKEQINALQQLNDNMRIDKRLLEVQCQSYQQQIQKASSLSKQLTSTLEKEQKLKSIIKNLEQKVNFFKQKSNQQEKENVILVQKNRDLFLQQEQKFTLIIENLEEKANFFEQKSNQKDQQNLTLIQKNSELILQKELKFKSIIQNLEEQFNFMKEKFNQKEEQNSILIQKNSDLILQQQSLNQSLIYIKQQINLYKTQLSKTKSFINESLKTFLFQQQSKFSYLKEEIQRLEQTFTQAYNSVMLEQDSLILKILQLEKQCRKVTHQAEKILKENINLQNICEQNQRWEDNSMILSKKITVDFVWSIILQYITQINERLHQQIHDYPDQKRILALQFKSLIKRIKQNYSLWWKKSRLLKVQ